MKFNCILIQKEEIKDGYLINENKLIKKKLNTLVL